ncbi:MAG: glucose-6-phosphate isomerase [Desulfobacterales bacterium SG8_35]|nr:MAG: glucose-6-phosphate isomerase [Desulfobacterales bacterium SG8_35]
MTWNTPGLDELPVYEKLRKLARNPYDLTAPGAISPGRISSYKVSAAGFDLLFSTQRLDDAVINGLQQLADQSGVVDQFLAMKRGAVMNSIEGYESEDRQVLHTASRDIFSDSPYSGEATQQARQQLENLKVFLDELDSGAVTNGRGETFTDYVNIGIGGSDLGPRALYNALAAYARENRKVRFISNVDPDDAAAVLQDLDLARTLVGVVSKSGSTLETLTNEEMVRTAYSRAGLDPRNHFVAITGQGSPMDNPEKYLRSFHMYDYIGGRYSATSMVGAVMLGFGLGYDAFIEILRGANAMDRAAEEREIRKNPALLLAVLGIWNHNFLGHETVAVLPYSQALLRFPAHLQQCDMESNGKSVTRNGERVSVSTGPIIWGEPGTNGQHAFYQLLHQGTTIVPAEFIGFRHCQHGMDLEVKGTTSQHKLAANLLAQALALATGRKDENPNRFFAGNRPSSILLADKLEPYTMGALLALYEAKIVMQGFIWNINSFDQEGVQLGKVLANRFLEHMTVARRGGARDRDKYPESWTMLETAGILPADEKD